jgi:membrane fusion protein (multidrug efflux system)
MNIMTYARIVIVLGLLTVGTLDLSGCKREAAPPPAPPAPKVEVVTVSSQSIPDQPEFIGQTEASRVVEIRSQVTGLIKERYYEEGRDVKKGDRLYQIDPIPFRAAMLSAQAKVSQAQARLVQAKQNLDRVKPLIAEQAVSQKDLDDAIAEDLSAKGALEGAKGELVKAKFDLDNTRITAPIDGLIERTRYYEGRLVTAQTDLLTVIHQVDPMYVLVNAPESFLLKRRRDIASNRIQEPDIYKLRGTITFSDGTVYPQEGVLDFTAPGLQVETGSREARVTFPNPNRVLLPGQFVKVRFKGSMKNDVMLVPQRAVQQGPTGSLVYVVGEGDKIEVRDVKAAGWQGNQWLVEEGLRQGDRVVVDGMQRLAPGAQVQPVAIASAGTSAAPSTAPSPAADRTPPGVKPDAGPTLKPDAATPTVKEEGAMAATKDDTAIRPSKKEGTP